MYATKKQSYLLVTKTEERAIESAITYDRLSHIALTTIKRILANTESEKVLQICGPITNGGMGFMSANLEVYEESIYYLRKEGRILWSQLPFEDKLQELRKKFPEQDLLESFYLPIFKSGYVELWFMPTWQSSIGARWEHTIASELGLPIQECTAEEWKKIIHLYKTKSPESD
jgi:hypothetical protein